MPKFYCDYCDTYLTHDSPSVRKTHCSGRKHKENVKDYSQKWMEEQAQSLIDKTTAAFQQGKIPPTPFSAPPPVGAMILPPPSLLGPPCPGMMPAPHTGGPPMMPMMGPPPPGMMPVGPAPGMRPPMGGHMPMMPGPPMMKPPAHPMMVPTRPGMTQPDRLEIGTSLYSFYITCSTSPGDHGAVTLGVFSQQDKEDLLPLPIKERIVFAGE
ncbi:U1 small nuclear ribonucleoprotein C-like [Callorhinus ursinus]|uniref:U1 small nuclear ribonucleoprotein C-like n=1 Tax=Callorhinus ursinus TaxID=34884 RepID=UPI003CD04B62